MKMLKRAGDVLLAVTALALALAGPGCERRAETRPNPKLKPYVLKTCPVSGEKLDGMGETYVFEYEGREIKLCCKNCLKDFQKNPAKYIKEIEKAEAEEKANGKL